MKRPADTNTECNSKVSSAGHTVTANRFGVLTLRGSPAVCRTQRNLCIRCCPAMSRRRVKAILLVALAGAVAASAAIAYAATARSSVSANYSVLRKAAKPSDKLSPDGRELARRLPSRFHLHPGDARRTRLKPGHGVWLVPGRDTVCLFIEQPDGGVRSSCNHLSGALTGALYLQEYRNGKVGSLRELTGALPDDGSNVQLVGAGGHTRPLDVRRNTYTTHLSKDGAASFKPREVTFEVDGTPYSYQLRH